MADEADAPQLSVIDDAAKNRFEIYADGTLAAFTRYRIEEPGLYAFMHTETVRAYEDALR